MEASITLRPLYGILFVLDDSLKPADLVNGQSVVTALKNNLVEIDGNLNDWELKNAQIRIRTYIGIGRRVPKPLKDELNKGVESTLNLPNPRAVWFNGKDYSREQIERWLRKYAGQDGCQKVWIVDPSTIITGDNLSKFEDI